MPWIRLSDNYVDHPKFLALSAFAFRLWHEGMAFARRHQTDGIIAAVELKGFRYFKPVYVAELTTPYREGAGPLWEDVEGVGYKIHDYLDWNPSKDEENERRAESKERMRTTRERRRSHGVAPVVAPPVAQVVRANTLQTDPERSHAVRRTFAECSGTDRDLKKSLEEKEQGDDSDTRAGRLLQELYPAWYATHRHGAKLRLVANSLAFEDALSVVGLWDDARIEKLAKIVLTTDDPFIANTDRSFRIFAMKATWADDRLRAWEKENGIAV